MKSRLMVAAVLLCVCAAATEGTHAPWPTDWNNWDDPALWVTVGNPGNTGQLSGSGAGGYGPDRICGAVAYTFNMGKFEVTAGQYTAFLNAVAKTDTYGLYNTGMWLSSIYSCQIQRTGSSGSYTYSVASDWASRPVTCVSWGDAARFANWLTNGQPSGEQSTATTEDGSYYLNGAMTNEALMAVTRKSTARYVIPSEDEWYKAAYHKNDGITDNYWVYPTGTNALPNNDLVGSDPGNSANYYRDHWTIGDPYYKTVVGEFENSASPYGTFDQGGNVAEWTEAVMSSVSRGESGGSFRGTESGISDPLNSNVRASTGAAINAGAMGFRIVEVPEPAPPVPEPVTLVGLLFGAVAVTRYARCRFAV